MKRIIFFLFCSTLFANHTNPIGLVSIQTPFVSTVYGSAYDILSDFNSRQPLTLFEDASQFAVRVNYPKENKDTIRYPIFMDNYRENTP